MRYLLIAWLWVFVAMQHPEPPEGWTCDRAGEHTAADHACECQRACVKNTNCDEEGNCTDAPGMRVQEDVKCKVYCHPKHCGCPLKECPVT